MEEKAKYTKKRTSYKTLYEIQTALNWYNKYKEYRLTFINKRCEGDMLSFEEWLEMLLK